jgi:hypothetical protein
MTILGLIVLIIFVGVVLGGVNRLLPMAPPIKSLLNLLVFILLAIYILQFFKIVPTILPALPFFNF